LTSTNHLTTTGHYSWLHHPRLSGSLLQSCLLPLRIRQHPSLTSPLPQSCLLSLLIRLHLCQLRT